MSEVSTVAVLTAQVSILRQQNDVLTRSLAEHIALIQSMQKPAEAEETDAVSG